MATTEPLDVSRSRSCCSKGGPTTGCSCWKSPTKDDVGLAGELCHGNLQVVPGEAVDLADFVKDYEIESFESAWRAVLSVCISHNLERRVDGL